MGYRGEYTVYIVRSNYKNAVGVFGKKHADTYLAHWKRYGYEANGSILVQNGMSKLGSLKTSPVFRYGRDMVLEDKELYQDIINHEPGVFGGKHVRYGSRAEDGVDWNKLTIDYPTIYKDAKTGTIMVKEEGEVRAIALVDETTGAIKKVGKGAGMLILLVFGAIAVGWLLLMGNMRK